MTHASRHNCSSPSFFSLSSYSGCVRPALHVQPDEEDHSQRWIFRTLPRHPAKLHESHSCCQHQLRGLRVHEDGLRNLLMLLQVTERRACTDLEMTEVTLRKDRQT